MVIKIMTYFLLQTILSLQASNTSLEQQLSNLMNDSNLSKKQLDEKMKNERYVVSNSICFV